MTGAPKPSGPIVVATNGGASAAVALEAAALIADRDQSPVVVLAVLEPLPLVAADYGLLLPPAETDAARRSSLEQRIRDQMRESVGERGAWELRILDGDPPATIVRLAREVGARMLVLGIGHHELLDRLFGGETALHTVRLARVPVFAVAPDFRALPTRLAIAIDFSDHSQHAAREALAAFPNCTLCYLVHVAPRVELQPTAYATWMSDYGEGVEPAFARVREQLTFPLGAKVETITLHGKPSKAVLEFAKSAHVETIVTGSRGAGIVDRILVGSTATGLIRGASCSVFAVPSPTAWRRGTGRDDAAGIPEDQWAHALQEFTTRNAGRLATLEVDDPEFGAQEQQHDAPFVGAAYDHHDRRIELMLGELEHSTRHLTRGIGDVRNVRVVRDDQGRDWALRIAHGSGQTILTLVR